MANLSPAAQAVIDAVLFEVNAECHAPWIAAAVLRAAADQVVPERLPFTRTVQERILYHIGRLDAAVRHRAELLAIATELEGHG
jgi:hypothetical protein